MSKLGPVATYEVLSSWIASAKNQDHLVCVQNYISGVFLRDYPVDVNKLHGELLFIILQVYVILNIIISGTIVFGTCCICALL